MLMWHSKETYIKQYFNDVLTFESVDEILLSDIPNQ